MTAARENPCRICGLGVNPVFGIVAHYDCTTRAQAIADAQARLNGAA
jgi:hypothetical protein